MRTRPESLRARRRWGQNFLVNRGAIEAILAAFRPAPDDLVLEIGPGRGALTRGLAGRVARLAAVEIDPDLAAALREGPGAVTAALRERPGAIKESFREGPGVVTAAPPIEIVQADALEIDLAALLAGMGASPSRPARAIANLPYGVATAILLRLLGQRALLRDLLVMVQREVAERIASPHGRKSYGGLSVLCQACARVESVLRLRPGSFRPRPKVDSEVLRLIPDDRLAGRDPEALSALVQAAFAQRRKTLLNNLGRLSGTAPGSALAAAPEAGPAGLRRGPQPRGALGPERAERLIRSAGLDPGARAEQVPVEGFLALLDAWTGPHR